MIDFISNQNCELPNKLHFYKDDIGINKDDYYIFAHQGSLFDKNIGNIISNYISLNPDKSIIYSDEIIIYGDNNQKRKYICKPELDVTMLVSNNYIGFPIILKGKVFKELNVNNLNAIELYKLILKLAIEGEAFGRIPNFLIETSESLIIKPNIDEQISVVSDILNVGAEKYIVDKGLSEDSLYIEKCFKEFPSVTLIVPTNRSINKSNDKPHIENFINSLMITDWPIDKLSLIIGDDVNINDNFYDKFTNGFEIKLVDTKRKHTEKFNYAKKMNTLCKNNNNEYIIFMNDDLVIEHANWLKVVMTFITQERVGGVGGKLLFPNGKIQHAGMIGGIFEVFAHPWYNIPDKEPTYGNWSNINREYSAVTGAIFATKKSVLDKIGGFDEYFSLDFNDVDMCLKICSLGYKIVYSPYVKMTHHESASRGSTFAPGDQIMTFLTRWQDVIADDPMYNPNLSRNNDVVSCIFDV